MPYSEINSLRKQGRLPEATALAENEYQKMPGKFEAIALFWCLNDELKMSDSTDNDHLVERMRSLAQKHDPDNELLKKVIASAENMRTPQGQAEKKGWNVLRQLQQTDVADINSRKRLLWEYLQLDNPRPSKLHSRIMAEALKMESAEPETFAFSKFADMWDLHNLSTEDWRQTTSKNGFKMPSAVERIISAYIREMHMTGTVPGPVMRELLDEAADQFPKNSHLARYQAQIMVKDGNISQAIDKYKELLLRYPEKFYLWDDLAEIVDDPDLKLALLCGAALTGVNDEFLVNIRLKLAEMLCNRQLYANALGELELYRAAHERKGWPLKRRYFNVANRIPADTEPVQNRLFFLQCKDQAEEFIFSALPTTPMVKVWEKKETFGDKTVLTWQLRHDQQSYWIKPRRFRLDFRTPNGAMFDVKASGNQIVWVKPCEKVEEQPWLKHVTGNLQIKHQGAGKIFGFVEGVFVPAHLLYARSEGSLATVLAIRNEPDRWAALTIE